ncbi:MAG: NADH-quinone oxidoreductase subunit L [Gammaproteobacteria bacterium]|jgi:NADH-quinone oxidoreductase subunit L|nr:NADH-quinone oxidoreductase subunit L [Gammaproteobacteria bacterium]MDH4004693.1 NADH-quinone oxidoreductase subunit L [Gammaproteobacteria bacterium]NCF60802.1 NADH-quinone oxidoreductase subunit L [Gammaproteobacteria bacterium]
MYSYYLTIVLAPLFAAIVAGLFGHKIGRTGAHLITIGAVGLSCLLSFLVLYRMYWGGAEPENIGVYTWAVTDGLHMEVGFLVDRLTVLMMAVVTFVSLMVHVYTIGYMHDDPGYQRFFSYISLFTFSMLMLVMSNNFLQLFFGWEAVGLVSYLLIGFWFKRETAIFANLKAFLVNRVGDFGFILGIAAIVTFTGSLDYATVFGQAGDVAAQSIEVFPGSPWNAMTLICILLFIGAMGKSAQAPLHVWLPDSMEGPTPISALIHAATMVTAGIFMVARMSPLFELSTMALAVVIVIGAITAFFMGLLGIVQNDIKRVVAYSTLSQLGYMTVALGASAYGAAIFHLMTHAFFKALLFLAAGSVIIAMHHEQDIRKMGGIRKYMPITYWTSLVGSLALIGFPGTAGFFSKDLLIEAVKESHWHGQGAVYWIAYLSVLLGVFVTALYSFRMFFLVFHGEERMDKATKSHLHEPPWVVTVPLIMLAIPSLAIGWFTVEPVLFGGFFGDAIVVDQGRDVLANMGEHWHGPAALLMHAWQTPVFWLAMAGLATAVYLYLLRPDLPAKIKAKVEGLYNLLDRKYYFDDLYIKGFAAWGRNIGRTLWQRGDEFLIDGVLVNGTANSVGKLAVVMRQLQSGYLYTYAFAMIIGLTMFLGWLIWFR